MFISSIAYAQQAAAQAPQPGLLEQLVPFGFVLVIFYFLLIRPQQKRAKQQAELLSALKRGDSVLTSGGILGTIEGLTDQFVTLEIADGVRVRILRSQISSLAKEEVKK